MANVCRGRKWRTPCAGGPLPFVVVAFLLSGCSTREGQPAAAPGGMAVVPAGDTAAPAVDADTAPAPVRLADGAAPPVACTDTGPNCPCPSGAPWPWAIAKPVAPRVLCTADGQLARAGQPDAVPLTCDTLCLCFTAEGTDVHGLCANYDELPRCRQDCAAWTDEQICCRAARCSAGRQSAAGNGQKGVPGFPTCGAPVSGHDTCGELRRGSPDYLRRWPACGVTGGKVP